MASRETSKGWEAHRREDPVAVHIADTLVDVVHARPHLGEAGGVAAPLLGGPGHHGVEPADALWLALIDPLVDTLVVGDHYRRLVPILGRYVTEEHVGRLY